jgi:putative hydrolase of the HAD superfamily
MTSLALRAVSFDFHNTLASCDAWFEVEVRTLVPDLLRWQARDGGGVSDATLSAAAWRYRALRQDVVSCGVERDAHACVLRVLEELELPGDPDMVRRGVAEIMRATLADATPLPGAVECVRALAARGLPLVVVSSAIYHPFLEWTLERFGILDDFEMVITSASCGFYKSRPEIYRHALDALGIAPAELVHIGDSLVYDVQSAGSLGVRTVWLNADSDGEHGADMRVPTLRGLAPALVERFG